MAAQGSEELAAEIDRIVNCPYPTQLKGLRDLLYSKCDEAGVARWAQSMPCQIDQLARCVLEGLRQWPYVLEIVEKLSLHIKIRDAFLRNEPSLLRDIVQQAAKSPDIQSRYTTAAVAMLSHDLPKDISMPSEVQSLFIRMFDHAAEQPSVETIKPIHRMLQGTSTLLIGLLSSNVLLRFEEHLFNILRNIKGDNQSLSLYCLSIMKMISADPSEAQLASFGDSCDTQELLASTQATSSRWMPDAMRQFFKESKAQKTMQLIVLRAMWACTTTTGEPFDERMESLLLANDIISAVPTHLRETWRKSNALVVRKLEEKALAPALELSLRYHALLFLIRLSEGYMHPPTVMDSLRQVLVKPELIKQALCQSRAADLNYLATCGIFDQNTTAALLQNTVDFAVSASHNDPAQTSGALRNILGQLPAAMVQEESITEGALLALDVLSCGQKMQSLSRLATSPSDNVGLREGICGQAVRNAQKGLVHDLCRVFLTAALSARHSTYAVGRETMALLLELHAASAHAPSPCYHVKWSRVTTDGPFTFAEIVSTPDHSAVNWREAVHSHLQSRAFSEQEKLNALFTNACADLEARCNDVQGPWREEQEERIALQKRYDDLSQAYAELETENIDRNIRFNALEMERDQGITDLETAREEVDRLTQRVDELEVSLRRAKSESEITVEEAKNAKEAVELEYATAFAKKEEEIEEMQGMLQNSSNELKEKEEELETFQQWLNDAESALEDTKGELEQVKIVRDEQLAEIDRLKSEKDEVVEHKNQIETTLRKTKEELDTAHYEHERKLAEFRTKMEQDMAAMETGNEQRISEITKEHEEAKENLSAQLEAVLNDSRQTQDKYSIEIEQRNFELAEKQKKIDRLGRKCEQRDKQIAEANAMRSNLMAAMGFSGSKQHRTKLPHRPSSASTAPTQQQEMDSQADPSPPTPFSGDYAETQPEAGGSFASNPSSGESKSGPTPKRARTRRPFKVPSPARPRVSTNVDSRTTRASVAGQSTVKRQPLLSVSANQSHKKIAGPKTPSKAASKEKLDDLDESTFDGSELFAGTPGERMLDCEGALNENLENRF